MPQASQGFQGHQLIWLKQLTGNANGNQLTDMATGKVNALSASALLGQGFQGVIFRVLQVFYV